MLSKVKIGPFNKGVIGVARKSNNAPYRHIKRKPENKSFGNESSFITPEYSEDIQKCPRGIKR